MLDSSIFAHKSSDGIPGELPLGGEQGELGEQPPGGMVGKSHSSEDAFLLLVPVLPLGPCTSRSKAPVTDPGP